MSNQIRKVLDKSFSAAAYCALVVMSLTVVVFLTPIIVNGIGAIVFKATVEHEKFLMENLDREYSEKVLQRIAEANAAREPLYKMMRDYERGDSAAYKKRLDNGISRALAHIESGSDKIFALLNETSAEARVRMAAEFSRLAWFEYLTELDLAAKEARASGNSMALAKVLQAQEDEISEAAKAALNELGEKKKLTFSQKSMLRRAFTHGVFEELKAKEGELHDDDDAYIAVKHGIEELLGPATQGDKEKYKLMRQKYGQTRMSLAEDVLKNSILTISITRANAEGAEVSQRIDSLKFFKNTPVEKMLLYVEDNIDAMLRPHWTIYWGFFTDNPYDSSIFGGIWPMILGTFYLTAGAMIMAAPLGIIAAIYFAEYAKEGKIVGILRMCVGTLAGVPSIVFGLFGLTFLINTLHVSDNKSVLAGAITLALLILPTIIRSCEEAVKAVPNSYREAAAGLGAGKWRGICSVILPSALPSMLTGIIISMGRAAGETAPIIFTAATSTGAALAVWEIFSQPTPALPWNIYNICSEHEMADKVQHVQYGMVLTLITIVLALNFAAIVIRARMQKKLKS